MTTLLRSGVEWLRDRLDEAAGESITYTVGPRYWTFNAVPSMVATEVASDEGVSTTVYDMEFIVTKATLEQYGITPAPGHRITFDGSVYQVFPLPSRKAEEPSDNMNVMVKLHTKRISA